MLIIRTEFFLFVLARDTLDSYWCKLHHASIAYFTPFIGKYKKNDEGILQGQVKNKRGNLPRSVLQ